MKNRPIRIQQNISVITTAWILFSLREKIYSHLVLFFQCKTVGNKNTPISLLITKPFYLLPYGSRDCQQVEWMVATSEWIKYHTDNYMNKTGQMFHNGTAPYHELGEHSNKGMKMYYCYYESCNYTLTDKEGVFQSPGFPGKYPDGQLCSWRIMVPDNHTLHVRFKNFSLDANDNLTFFQNDSGRFYLNDTHKGHHNQPFTITATSDVLFAFVTNEEGNSTGFRAEYTIFKTSETTPSQPPRTTLNTGQHTSLNTISEIQHTTTLPSIEAQHTNNNSTSKKYIVGKSKCFGESTVILVVIPLVCLTVVIVIVMIIVYRWRSKKTKCEKCASSRYRRMETTNPTYDDGGQHIPILQRTGTDTIKTTLGTEEKDGKMHQPLLRDQKNFGYSEWHELESIDSKAPDMVYDTSDGPDPDKPSIFFNPQE